MADYGSTERVRRFVVQHLFEPARNRGESTITIHSRSLAKILEKRNVLAANRYPVICGAMDSPAFAQENGVVLTSREGKKLSSKTTFTFALQAEATSSRQKTPLSTPISDELSVDASYSKLRGVLKGTYEQLGGAEAFHCRERESWER